MIRPSLKGLQLDSRSPTRRLGMERLEDRFPLDGDGNLASGFTPVAQDPNDPVWVDVKQDEFAVNVETPDHSESIKLLQQSEATFYLMLGSTDSILNGALSASIVIEFDRTELQDAGWVNPIWVFSESTLETARDASWIRQFTTYEQLEGLETELLESDPLDSSLRDSSPPDTRFVIRLGNAALHDLDEARDFDEDRPLRKAEATFSPARVVFQFLHLDLNSLSLVANPNPSFDSISNSNTRSDGPPSSQSNLEQENSSNEGPLNIDPMGGTSKASDNQGGNLTIPSEPPLPNQSGPSKPPQPAIDQALAFQESGIELPRSFIGNSLRAEQLDPISNSTPMRDQEKGVVFSPMAQYRPIAIVPSAWTLDRELHRELVSAIATLSHDSEAIFNRNDQSLPKTARATTKRGNELDSQIAFDHSDDTLAGADGLAPIELSESKSSATSPKSPPFNPAIRPRLSAAAFVFRLDRSSKEITPIEVAQEEPEEPKRLSLLDWIKGSVWNCKWEGTLIATAISLGVFYKQSLKPFAARKEKSNPSFSWGWISGIEDCQIPSRVDFRIRSPTPLPESIFASDQEQKEVESPYSS